MTPRSAISVLLLMAFAAKEGSAFTSFTKTPSLMARAQNTGSAARSRLTPSMSVWSNSKTTADYMGNVNSRKGMDFSDNDVDESLCDQASTIIGAGGRIGGLLAKLGKDGDLLIGRGEKIPEDAPPGPIYVCTRNDVLKDVIDACPESRREDLVFMQNGMIEIFLNKQGVGGCTQALLYFAVPAKGAKPVDGKIPSQPEGLTCVMGKWGHALKQRLDKADLLCNVVQRDTFRRAMFEKLIWISAYMLIGAATESETVGRVDRFFKELLEDLIWEMRGSIGKRTAINFATGLETRLSEYAMAVEDFPIGVKEWEWRNGYFWAISRNAIKNARPGALGHPDRFGKREELPTGEDADPMPLHSMLCRKAKELGAITFELPEDEGGVDLF
uniref:Uncharacterized protein n=1 Tax=Fibrocapsa japonica TaxID=94617 RepID=A0A7S2UY16_9STRA|eukprot:CAMPEP_0113944576 /NCGR_PEP_ID=MMETSP1339-20121228/34555_1 /TAXON_ID=94617 /ORGANISM="Fibrocapsa japonica" /LENGTH=385 /DNA_ID=CAMNT_0000949819 /DNA_START=63 /DNA_END=1220 /DNA_ORIENTATION=+ /assembly_acc=CAM_ASM_000762